MSLFRSVFGVLNTRFGEQLSAVRSSQFNFKPTWGLSLLRYKTTAVGTGSTADETNGEFRLQSGTSTNGGYTIETNQRGQYQAGAMGQSGIGVRIPTLPTSTQYAEWGYTDFTNGFYFGVDATGKYIGHVTGSAVTKVYQANWNIDKLDGTGRSARTLTLSLGQISHIDFTWYGYGDIEFSYFIQNPSTLKIERYPCHVVKIDSSTSIIDPNQPLSFRVNNGASSTTDFSMYIGGHQFSIVDGFSTPQNRQVSEVLFNYTTVANILWQPLISIRKRSTFRSRNNSVNARIESFGVSADGPVQVRLTVGGVTSNGTFATPTDWTTGETSLESKVTVLGTALAATTGYPYEYSSVAASSNNQSSRIDQRVVAIIGKDQEVILWVRRNSGAGTVIIGSANLAIIEEW
jgi:hypothetical protein